MNTKLLLLIGTSLSFLPQLTFAQCVATQDCAALGYTETSCNGGKGIKCPFGNKWACLKTDSECEQEACAKYGFKYSCSGTNQSGGSGVACGGKYTACNCSSGYEWKNGSCQEQNGASGEFYYCKGKVVGVKTTGMNFYVAMENLEDSYRDEAVYQCEKYSFCDNLNGKLPSEEQLKIIGVNISRINTLLSRNGSKAIPNGYYWSISAFADGPYDPFNYIYVDIPYGYRHTSMNPNKTYKVRPVLTSW